MFFLICTSTGVLLMFGYDLLRAVRRVFIHGSLLLALEDFIYWSAAGILAFGVIFLKNSGVVRGFSLCAMMMGMVLYQLSASRPVLKAVSGVLRFLKKVVGKFLKIIGRPLAFFAKKMRKGTKKPKKVLKKRIKEIKMSLFVKKERNQ